MWASGSDTGDPAITSEEAERLCNQLRGLEKINKKAQDDLAQMRDKIAMEADNVRISLQKEVDVFANAIGQKILGRVF